MALTNCKECGNQISDTATKCPHCGASRSDAIGFSPSAISFFRAAGLLTFIACLFAIYASSQTAIPAGTFVYVGLFVGLFLMLKKWKKSSS